MMAEHHIRTPEKHNSKKLLADDPQIRKILLKIFRGAVDRDPAGLGGTGRFPQAIGKLIEFIADGSGCG